MSSKKKEQTVGRPEPEFKIDILTIIWIIFGFVVSWVNMLIMLGSMEIWSYLTIIFTTIIPTVIIALKNRYWGYGYLFGFAIAGIPFSFLNPPYGDLFIGWYTFATSFFIFIILWLIFWKTWRSLSSIKQVKT
ncbi:MAG: hypothetical protein JSV23_08945 [Promethearchaeota archaeon]|nr:MAG: hypothetical protein JSV23_08945 [Candidatus Lokiarchaeota archaeon]